MHCWCIYLEGPPLRGLVVCMGRHPQARHCECVLTSQHTHWLPIVPLWWPNTIKHVGASVAIAASFTDSQTQFRAWMAVVV